MKQQQQHYIDLYLDQGFNIIPLSVGTKKPKLTRFKSYLYSRKTTDQDLATWYDLYGDYNLGLVTGDISRLLVVDCDLNKELVEKLGGDPVKIQECIDNELLNLEAHYNVNLHSTTFVNSYKSRHFYFNLDSTSYKSSLGVTLPEIDNLTFDIKSQGGYVVAPYSLHPVGVTYTFEKSLDNLQPLDNNISTLFDIKVNDYTPPVNLDHKLRIKGTDKLCLTLLDSQDYAKHTREVKLFLYYHLLLRSRYTRDHSRDIVRSKNASLSHPLSDNELYNKVFKPVDNNHNLCYNYSCGSDQIQDTLNISCQECQYYNRGLRKMIDSVSYNLAFELGDLEFRLYHLITFKLGGVYTTKGLAESLGKSRPTIIKALNTLRDNNLIH